MHSVTPLPTPQVNVEDTVEMLPKSRRALTIQEIAALARSSLHGNRPGKRGQEGGRWGPCIVPVVLIWRCSRHLAGGEGACDEANGHGAGPRRTPHRVEGLVQTRGATRCARERLQLLLPPERGRAGGTLRCRWALRGVSVHPSTHLPIHPSHVPTHPFTPMTLLIHLLSILHPSLPCLHPPAHPSLLPPTQTPIILLVPTHPFFLIPPSIPMSPSTCPHVPIHLPSTSMFLSIHPSYPWDEMPYPRHAVPAVLMSPPFSLLAVWGFVPPPTVTTLSCARRGRAVCHR